MANCIAIPLVKFFSNMFNFLRLFGFLSLLGGFPATSGFGEDGGQDSPQGELRTLVERENRLLRLREGWEEIDDEAWQERFQALADQYDAFVADNPEYVPGLVAYGLFLDRLGYHEQAAAYLAEANRRDPNIPVVKNQLGNYLRSQEEFETALGYYLAASELAPSEALYHFQVGHLLLEQREYFEQQELLTSGELEKQMMAALRRAWELDPSEPQYGYHLGLAFNDLQEPNWLEALSHWQVMEEKVIQEFDRQLMKVHQARILIHLSEYAKAREILGQVSHENLRRHRDRVMDLLP